MVAISADGCFNSVSPCLLFVVAFRCFVMPYNTEWHRYCHAVFYFSREILLRRRRRPNTLYTFWMSSLQSTIMMEITNNVACATFSLQFFIHIAHHIPAVLFVCNAYICSVACVCACKMLVLTSPNDSLCWGLPSFRMNSLATKILCCFVCTVCVRVHNPNMLMVFIAALYV